MSSTSERLYYADSYCTEFDAIVQAVTRHEGRWAAVLDRTAFYPESGGQLGDIGTTLHSNVFSNKEKNDFLATKIGK